MANIQKYLEQILSARYGKDVRQSIHDAIQAIDNVADGAKDSATASAKEASTYALQSKSSADSAQASSISANSSKVSADLFATRSESWAVGGTGSRTDENVTNSKYYSEQAAETLALCEGVKAEVDRKLEIATFDVDDNGNLVYTDGTSYNFSIDENGNLTWEVIE